MAWAMLASARGSRHPNSPSMSTAQVSRFIDPPWLKARPEDTNNPGAHHPATLSTDFAEFTDQEPRTTTTRTAFSGGRSQAQASILNGFVAVAGPRPFSPHSVKSADNGLLERLGVVWSRVHI